MSPDTRPLSFPEAIDQQAAELKSPLLAPRRLIDVMHEGEVRYRGLSFPLFRVGGRDHHRYFPLLEKKSKEWRELPGGEVSWTDFPTVEAFIDECAADYKAIPDKFTSIHEYVRAFSRYVYDNRDSVVRAWTVANLVREIGEELGRPGLLVPTSLVDFTHSAFDHIEQTTGLSVNIEAFRRHLGLGLYQYAHAYLFDVPHLFEIGETDEHRRGDWVRWPSLTEERLTKGDRAWLLSTIAKGSLYAQRLGRKDMFSLVFREEESVGPHVKKIENLSDYTSAALLHAATAEMAGQGFFK